MARLRIVQVGLGSRGRMYWQAVTEKYADRWELVGICDSNPGRLEHVRSVLSEKGIEAGAYIAADFDRMLAECTPDTVVVTSKDSTHDGYITGALKAGSNVITEKPLTIDERRLQAIIDTVRETGRAVRVTFNYRYSPVRARVKEVLASGAVGRVLSVDFNWNLDTSHGADYYRRWHRHKESSGGLMVHKATHHFDLANWWLDSVPHTVYAAGKREFYTEEQAASYSLTVHGHRCQDCHMRDRCRFFLDISANESLKALYLDHEKHDGYFRDRCVFSSAIDIEDTMCLVVRFKSGVIMSYSLNSFLPWEGYRVAFNGTKGRLEHDCQETVYVSGDGTTPGQMKAGATTITLYPHFASRRDIPVLRAEGGHGGGDEPLLDDIFAERPGPDPLGRRADHRAGAWSILAGIAANRSMETGEPVEVSSLVKGLCEPDLP